MILQIRKKISNNFCLSGSTDHNNFLPIFAGMADQNLKNDQDNLDKQQRKEAGS